MKKVDQEEIRKFYDEITDVWDPDDVWHQYSKHKIEYFIARLKFLENGRILNAGSGGNEYNICNDQIFHVDIAAEKIKHKKNNLVANIENLPFGDGSFSNIICVGSVINYCDAIRVISEFSRVLEKSGHLILEFESSWGFEYTRHESYKKSAFIESIEYINQNHNQWLFSPQYIRQILASYHIILE